VTPQALALAARRATFVAPVYGPPASAEAEQWGASAEARASWFPAIFLFLAVAASDGLFGLLAFSFPLSAAHYSRPASCTGHRLTCRRDCVAPPSPEQFCPVYPEFTGYGC